MLIIAVDDEKLALEGMTDQIKKAVPDAQVYGFRSVSKAMEFIDGKKCDVAFLDIDMREMNGIEFAKVLKKKYPKLNIIFTTGYDEYMKEAFSLHASGYILKPVTAEKIAAEMQELRHPLKDEKKKEPVLKVRTFGNFEVYEMEHGERIKFQRNKSKELFAYLIHKRGTSCSTKELMALLYENRPCTDSLQRQFQTILSSMMKTLKTVNAQECIIRKRNQTAVDPELIDCDYYAFVKGDPVAIQSYKGEYMANYSWSEYVAGYLDEKFKV